MEFSTYGLILLIEIDHNNWPIITFSFQTLKYQRTHVLYHLVMCADEFNDAFVKMENEN